MRTTTNINTNTYANANANANAVKIKTKINEKIPSNVIDSSASITSPTINVSATNSTAPTTANSTNPTPITTTTPTTTPPIATPVTTPIATLKKKKVFILDFNGGITASQCQGLREEITAILLAIKQDTYTNTDETYEYSVLLKLKSGGGTVTGYGLAAGMLSYHYYHH